MYKTKILSVGKTKEPWLLDALNEYTKRLRPIMTIEWILVKDSKELDLLLEKETHFLSLDPQGKSFSSETFSEEVQRQLIKGGSRLTFVIGGAEGLSASAKARSALLISLSPLTFTHQLTRLILLEQIYRAFEIAKGTGYHK